MAKRTLSTPQGSHLVASQGLLEAPVLARLCAFLARRGVSNELWCGHEALADREFLARHGLWRGPYDAATLFFFLDEYAKDQPKDLSAVLKVTGEMTEVNEMLQGMERYKSIFICTTNFLERLDQAALRRFTFKIQFKPLGRIRKEQAFVKLACKGNALALTSPLQTRLAVLEQLCLGDFAAVRRQAAILDTVMQPDEFLEQWEAEHRIKPEVREAGNMGFLV